jgi:hypothetical protein
MITEILYTGDDTGSSLEKAEAMEAAWLRLFGVPFDAGKQIDHAERGDVAEYVFPNGVVVCNYYGAYYTIERMAQ